MIAGGGIIKADEALRIGLVNAVVSPAELMTKAREIATRIVGNGPQAVRIALDCIRSGQDRSLTDGLEYELEAFANLFETAEMQEGTRAFVEKRPPEFRKD